MLDEDEKKKKIRSQHPRKSLSSLALHFDSLMYISEPLSARLKTENDLNHITMTSRVGMLNERHHHYDTQFHRRQTRYLIKHFTVRFSSRVVPLDVRDNYFLSLRNYPIVW